MGAIKQELLEELRGLPVIDAHEHLAEPAALPTADFLSTGVGLSYFGQDLAVAGWHWDRYEEVMDSSIPVLDRWRILEPYWQNARNTGYGQCVERSARELYGVDRVDSGTIEELNRRFVEANSRPDHYREVLKDHCKIEYSVNDKINGMEYTDNPLFVYVERVDSLVEPRSQQDLGNIGAVSGVPINSLGDFEEACIATQACSRAMRVCFCRFTQGFRLAREW